MEDNEIIKPIKSVEFLEELLASGYTIIGPRKNSARDLAAFKAFVKKGKEFTPESWLARNGYKFVEPSTFTKGHRIAYKMINDFPDERFNSNYFLSKEGQEIPLYLKADVPKQDKSL